MTPDQFTQLLTVLTKLADRSYTLTGAADWPILTAMGFILIALLGWIWRDLKATIKEGKIESKDDLTAYKTEHEKEHTRIWQAHRDCQIDCCTNRGKD